MPVYFTAEISEDEQISRKQFEFAKSLGVETLAVERTPKSLPAIEKLADGPASMSPSLAIPRSCSTRYRAAAGESGRMPISANGCRRV